MTSVTQLTFTIDTEQEEDGRWIAEVKDFPGVQTYGNSEANAITKAKVLALRVIADQLAQDLEDEMDEIKAQIAQELETAPQDFYFQEVLHFVRFLKHQYELEIKQDIEDAHTALKEAEQEGTVPLEQVKQELGL